MKVFRTLRQELLMDFKFRRYFFYAVGEILLVVIGILLAFQVDKWNDARLNRIEELKYYNTLKGDLEQQRDAINNQFEYNGSRLDLFRYALENSTGGNLSAKDSLIHIIPYLFDYSDYDQTGNIYETLVNSGEIKLIDNNRIIKGVRDLEWRYQYINRMENIHWDVILGYVAPWASARIKFASLEAVDSQDLYSYEFQNILILLQRIMDEKQILYESTIEDIDELLKELQRELEQGS